MSTELVMSSNHLELCRPLLLLLSIFLSIRVFSNEPALRIKWPNYWTFNFSISLSNEYSGLISYRIDWFDLAAVQGTLESPPTPQFKSINSSMHRLLYGPALTSRHDYWENHSLDSVDLYSVVSCFSEVRISCGMIYPIEQKINPKQDLVMGSRICSWKCITVIYIAVFLREKC